MDKERPPIVVIAGPTAVGKTTLGIKVAQSLESEVISADSRQIYRYMEIGTAKPTLQERETVKHHGLDLIDPEQIYSAGQFGRFAWGLMQDLWQQGKVPVLVGGSGLYIQAVLNGLFEDRGEDKQIRLDLRRRWHEEGVEILHQELMGLDPVSGSRLAPSDAQRILRALEVALKGGDALDQAWRSAPIPGITPHCFALDLERESLYERIEARAEAMLKNGFIEEVKMLLDKGYDSSTYALDTLGYQEGIAHLNGDISAGQVLEALKMRTRQYAKRQMTWFRNDRRLRWLDGKRWGIDGCAQRIVDQVRDSL
jgi:tRNA dimethylallyltransferase